MIKTMVLHKIDLQHCLWRTQQYYFVVWCAEVVNRKMCKLLNLAAIGLLRQGLLYQGLKKLYFFYLWVLNFPVCNSILALELFIWQHLGEKGNGQMSINKGLHLVVKSRYDTQRETDGRGSMQCLCASCNEYV